MVNDDYYNMKWFRVWILVVIVCCFKNVMIMGINEKFKIIFINYFYFGWIIFLIYYNVFGVF